MSMDISLTKLQGDLNVVKQQVEGAKTLLEIEVDRLTDQVRDMRSISAELRQMARQFVETSVKLDRIIATLDGTGAHDIGLVKRMTALESNAITKPQIALFTAFVASLWGIASGIVSASIHWPWNASH